MARYLLPTTDLSVMHVRNILSYPSTDVGTLCGGVAAAAAKINKWSKKKPVRYTADNVDGITYWWKANDGKCGLSFPVYTSPGAIGNAGSFLYQLVNQLDKWDYAPPRGGSVEPFRLGDFRGYYHDAIIPVEASGQEDYYISVNNTIQIDFDLAVPSGDPDNLTLSDLVISGIPLSDYYIGVVLYKNSSTYMIGTSTSKMGTGSASTIISGITQSRVGVWTVYTFLSKASFSTGGSIPASTFICFPLPPLKINIKGTGTIVQIYCIGNWTSSARNKVSFTITVDNTGSGQVTLINVKAIFVRTKGTADPESSGETVVTYSYPIAITVPGKQKVVVGPFEQSITYASGYTYWIAGQANLPDLKTSYIPIEDVAEP